jgi:hypothetical protein
MSFSYMEKFAQDAAQEDWEKGNRDWKIIQN